MAAPIVIGLDGSQASRTALAWAVEAAVLGDRPLSVIGAFDPVPSASAATMTLPGDVLDALRDQVTEVVDDGVAYARSLTATTDVTGEVIAGSAVSALVDASAGAAMTVVGTRHLTGVRGLFLGSVSINVAAHATSDVAVIGGPSGDGPVVAAVDGSPLTERVLERAFMAADIADTSVTVVHAWTDLDESTLATGSVGPSVDGATARVEAQVRSWIVPVAERFRLTSVDVVITPDGAVPAIGRVARDARMVVIGSRGRGGLAGMLLGSTSQDVIRHAERPVLVVKD